MKIRAPACNSGQVIDDPCTKRTNNTGGIAFEIDCVEVTKSMVPDAGNAGGNRDTYQASAAPERMVPDAGDRQTIGCTGNYDRAAGTGVSSDGDCIREICNVSLIIIVC